MENLNIVSSALTTEKNLNLVKPTYGFIDTTRIVDRFERQGWQLSNSRQVKVKNIERDGFQKHLLTFRNESFKSIPGLPGHHESIPELIVENSHDGSSALRVFFGVFRIACLNGIIAGSMINSMRVIHSENSIKRLDESIDVMTGGLPELIERVGKFSSIQLSDEQRVEFARQAAGLRLAHDAEKIHDVNLHAMLNPRRFQDNQNDAFSVFNVLQEKVIRGGIIYKKLNEKTSFIEKRTSRPVNSVNQSVKMNRGLWNILETIAA